MLIGRDHPVGVLRAAIGRTAESHGGLVLVTGDAGIGKTTLVTAAAEEARTRGALVLTGSCWDSDSAPGYWPWVQVVRRLRAACPDEAAAGPLSALLGEGVGAGPAGDFALYDAVTSALVSGSRTRPVVVVLDDLHWADGASLTLLEFAARHTWFERLLLVGTYRDAEVEPADHPLLTSLAARATTVTLTGLDRVGVGALVARTVGREPEADLVAEVHRRTGGNPFFVEQTARLWGSGGSVTAVAPGVREAVARRLSLLPAQVVELLTAAAVIGQEFHRELLSAVAVTPASGVDQLLDQACAVRLVRALDGDRFAFDHDLVRETLYDSLDEADARKRHAAVVRALGHTPAIRGRILPADLAGHAYLANAELAPDTVVEHLLAAARDAASRLAVEESIGHLRRALGLTHRRRRVLIALDLGRTLHHRGDRDEAWSHLADAAAAARELDDPELLARVALTGHRFGEPDGRPDFVAGLLVEAHRRLIGDSGPPSLDRLALDLTTQLDTLARSGHDDEALGFSLWSRHDTIWGLGTAVEREQLTRELADLARRTADHDMEQVAASLRWVALLEQDDPRYLAQLHAFFAMVERAGQPRMRVGALMDRTIIATLTGHFGEAHETYERAANFPEPHVDQTAHMFMMKHIRWALLLQEGRFDELDELHRELPGHGYPYPRLVEAIVAVQRGDIEAAQRYRDEGPYPGTFTPLWLRFQAQLAAATRESEACERARAALTPYAGQWLVALLGCDIGGPVSLWLARLDAAQRRWDDAIAGFTAARRSADALHARPWSIEARADLAAALLSRDSAGDRATAAALSDEVERDAAELGMRHVAKRAHDPRSTVDMRPTRGDPRTGHEFRFDGDVWTLSMAGRTAHMSDAKGLHDLHFLLSQPHTDIPAVRLLDPAGGEVVVAARSHRGDDILDAEARTRYRRHLARLDEEIDLATGRGDDERGAELDREREALLTELRAAAGLAGRHRRLGDEAERARKAVTARIHHTLRKLEPRHPELAEHLRAAVSTGTTCRYQPDDAVRWRL